MRLQPNFPEAYNNLAVLLNDVDQPDLAAQCCRRGIQQDSDSAALYANLATAMQNLGRLDEAIEFARKSVELEPGASRTHSNLLYKLNSNPNYDIATIFQEHLNWARRHAEPLTASAASHGNNRSPDRRLRIGYVSPYFRDHAVNFFSEPMIAAHDHKDFEIFCYSDAAIVDAVTERFRPTADHWRETRFQTDEELADTIRGDAIDILVDLTGHIGGNRLLDVCPQAGADSGDLHRLSEHDRHVGDGLSADRRLVGSAGTDRRVLHRAAGATAASVFLLPAFERGPGHVAAAGARARHVTFGSFNNFAKVTPGVLDAWLEHPALAFPTRDCWSWHMRWVAGGSASGTGHESAASIRRGSSCAKNVRGPRYLDLHRAGRHRAGSLSVQRPHDDLRRDLDGRAGGDAGRSELRLAIRR